MSVIRVGDIVRATSEYDGNESIVGKIGKVIGVNDYGISTVEFFESVKNGHHVERYGGRDGHCWSITDALLDVVYPVKNDKFLVGDLVMLSRNVGPFKNGAPGIVKAHDRISVLVEFLDYRPSAHNGDGLGKPGHCWWTGERDLELIHRPEVEK